MSEKYIYISESSGFRSIEKNPEQLDHKPNIHGQHVFKKTREHGKPVNPKYEPEDQYFSGICVRENRRVQRGWI